MEIKKITPEQRIELRKPLPDDAVSQHPTKTFLSSIKAIYVVERLNDVFGIGEWKIKNKVMSSEGKWVIVQAFFTVNGYDVEIDQFGGNDNADPGDAYKGAATDALTKIGSYLEIGIDVFKGNQVGKAKKKPEGDDKNQNEKSPDGTEKGWLKEEQLQDALKLIKEGKTGIPEYIYNKYKVSKAYRKQLDECKPDKK